MFYFSPSLPYLLVGTGGVLGSVIFMQQRIKFASCPLKLTRKEVVSQSHMQGRVESRFQFALMYGPEV